MRSLPVLMNEFCIRRGWANPSIVALHVAAAITLMAHGVNAQVQCNPAIDGTYCATAGIPDRSQFRETPKRDGLGPAVSGAGFCEQPATLGALTFSSRGRCIGLIRRVDCKD